MKHHLVQRTEDLFIIALSEKEATPGYLALLEYIAIMDIDHYLLNVLQQDALASRLKDLGKATVAAAYLSDTPTGKSIIKTMPRGEEEDASNTFFLRRWWNDLRTPRSRVIFRRMNVR